MTAAGIPRQLAVSPVSSLPPAIARATEGCSWWRDTVGQTGALVHRLQRPDHADLYLKQAGGTLAPDIRAEAARLRWLDGLAPVPHLVAAIDDDATFWLLMTAVPGLTAYEWLQRADAERSMAIVTLMARTLRSLHALDVASCPFDSGMPIRLDEARRRMDAGLVDEEDFGDRHRGWRAGQVWDAMMAIVPPDMDRVVTHGDYSLDNIVIDGDRVGLIDLGRVGSADRYQDLAIAHESLGEFGPALQHRFWREYGIDEPDADRLAFHRCLDEFF